MAKNSRVFVSAVHVGRLLFKTLNVLYNPNSLVTLYTFRRHAIFPQIRFVLNDRNVRLSLPYCHVKVTGCFKLFRRGFLVHFFYKFAVTGMYKLALHLHGRRHLAVLHGEFLVEDSESANTLHVG